MAGILYPPLRPQSIGEVLDSAFRIFGATLPRCLPFGVLAMVAGQLPNIVTLLSGRSLQRFGGDDALWWLAYLLGSVMGITCLNVILIRQEEATSASDPPHRSAVGGVLIGLRRAPLAIAVFLLEFLIVGLCYLPLAAVSRRDWSVGIPILSIPAAYVGLLLCCSWPALLIGGRSILGSLRYSAQLVRGNWWRSAAVFTVAISMLAVLYVCAGVIAAVVLPLTGNADLARITAVSAVMGVALGSLYVPFFAAISLALYGDLEARRQGTDLERRLASAVMS